MRTGVASGARVSGTGGGVRESEAPSPEAAPHNHELRSDGAPQGARTIHLTGGERGNQIKPMRCPDYPEQKR